MDKMKYLLNSEDHRFVIFPDYIKHSDIMGDWDCAGFIQFYEKEGRVKVHCYGKSVSLGLKSREEKDTYIIQSKINPDF